MKINLFNHLFDYVVSVLPVASKELHLDDSSVHRDSLLPLISVTRLLEIEETLEDKSIESYRKGCAMVIADTVCFIKHIESEQDKALITESFLDESILSRFDKFEDSAVLGK